MTVELITPPNTTPVTLAEVKEQLAVTFDDHDDLITRLIGAAVSMVDGTGDLGRAMITQTWRQVHTYVSGRVELFLAPFQTLDAIQYYDADGTLQAEDISEYRIYEVAGCASIEPNAGHSWPVLQRRPDALRIEYTCGYGDEPTDVPESIRHAIILLVAHWYRRREDAEDAQVYSIPHGYHALLNQSRTRWYG